MDIFRTFVFCFSVLVLTFGIVASQRCQIGSPLARNPVNCSTYLQCEHGNYIVRPCPTGLQFNVASQVCDWPRNVNCREEYYPQPPPTPNNPECYSCVYVESRGNLSNAGCGRNPIPSHYKRLDCFGFGDVAVAGSVRHTNSSYHNDGRAYCVTYKGRSELDGSLVILRGCEFFPTRDDFKKEKCFSSREYDFLYPRLGFVRNVEKCYCKGNNCNGSQSLSAAISLVLFAFAGFVVQHVCLKLRI